MKDKELKGGTEHAVTFKAVPRQSDNFGILKLASTQEADKFLHGPRNGTSYNLLIRLGPSF